MIVSSDKPRMPPPSVFGSVNTRTKTNNGIFHYTQREQAQAFLHYDRYAQIVLPPRYGRVAMLGKRSLSLDRLKNVAVSWLSVR